MHNYEKFEIICKELTYLRSIWVADDIHYHLLDDVNENLKSNPADLGLSAYCVACAMAITNKVWWEAEAYSRELSRMSDRYIPLHRSVEKLWAFHNDISRKNGEIGS